MDRLQEVAVGEDMTSTVRQILVGPVDVVFFIANRRALAAEENFLGGVSGVAGRVQSGGSFLSLTGGVVPARGT